MGFIISNEHCINCDIMIKITGIIKKRGNLFVVMIPNGLVKKEKLNDGEKVKLVFKKTNKIQINC